MANKLQDILSRAIWLHQNGRFDEALRGYRDVLKFDRDNFDALHLGGVCYIQMAAYEKGIKFISNAIKIKPGIGVAYSNLANAYQALGKNQLALQNYDKALKLTPDLADAWYNRGNSLKFLGRHSDAIESYNKALSFNAEYAEAYANRGDAKKDLGLLEEAIEDYSKAIALKANFAMAYCHRANCNFESKNFQDAALDFEAAINIDPLNADAYLGCGNVAMKLKNYDIAIDYYQRSLKLKPDQPESHLSIGLCFYEQKNYERAINFYQSAIRVQPTFALSYFNLGNVFADIDRHSEAIIEYKKVVKLDQDFKDVYLNMGNSYVALHDYENAIVAYLKSVEMENEKKKPLINLGNAFGNIRQFDKAEAAYDQAIALDPDFADAYFSKSFLYLLNKKYIEGFQLYEWRWKIEKPTSTIRDFNKPLWLGQDDIQGRSILLHAEQGLGDTIHFCRYIKAVKTLGFKTICEVQPPLYDLMRDLEGVDEVVCAGSQLPDFDYHCPLGSLPLAFKTDLNSIPADTPYLHVDEEKRTKWKNILGPKVKLRIGLVWSGNKVHINDRNRSIPLQTLVSQLPDGIDYISLQKEIRESDRSALEASRIRFLGDQIEDFSDTAALCDLVDLVISVDTSVAHLSGALGKATWIFLPFAPDWRWLLDHDDSPWYPTVRLYRQDQARDWSVVLNRAAEDILKLKAKY
jgi:tetratricopeptide (TPR) repeat protein